MTAEIHSAIGRITRVELVAGEAIFVEVELQHYMGGDGEPLEARARWCPAHAGAGYGDWALPDVGRAVVLVFPEPGNLDDGYAVAYASFSDAPPVDGVDASLSATTRVLRGKSGVAEQRETGGALKWFLRAAADLLCDAVMKLTGTQILIVSSDVQIGSGTLRKLMNDVALAAYNTHTHSGVQPGAGVTGQPTTALVIDTHTTTHTLAS